MARPVRSSDPNWSIQGVRRFLEPYGIRGHHLRATELAHGADNLNLLIEAAGDRLVLRRYDVTPAAEVDFELELIRFLSARDFPTAPLVHRADDQLHGTFAEKPAALFRFVEGKHPQRPSLPVACQLASILARLHLLTATIHPHHSRSRTDLNRLSALQTFVADHAGSPLDPDLPAFVSVLRAFRTEFAARSASYLPDLPIGVVHHDPHDSNVLVDATGRVVALLDFDEAHVGPFLSDLAGLLTYWTPSALVGDGNPGDARTVLHAYLSQRVFTIGEAAMLPDFIALLYLADASEFILRALQRDTRSRPVAICHSFRNFCAVTTPTNWRDRLRDRILAVGI